MNLKEQAAFARAEGFEPIPNFEETGDPRDYVYLHFIDGKPTLGQRMVMHTMKMGLPAPGLMTRREHVAHWRRRRA